jgi:hypothetical protein
MSISQAGGLPPKGSFLRFNYTFRVAGDSTFEDTCRNLKRLQPDTAEPVLRETP